MIVAHIVPRPEGMTETGPEQAMRRCLGGRSPYFQSSGLLDRETGPITRIEVDWAPQPNARTRGERRIVRFNWVRVGPSSVESCVRPYPLGTMVGPKTFPGFVD